MTSHDPLPTHLERIGCQLTAVAEDLYAPGPRAAVRRARSRLASPPSFVRTPRFALAGVGAGLAAAAAVTVFGAAGTQPAYALTQNSNGTYTATINNIATGVPALNAKLKQLGINITAIPVSTTCTAPNDGFQLTSGESSPPSPAPGPGRTVSMSETVTLDQANIPAGSTGVIVAYQAPSGQIDVAMGTTTGSIPSCLNPRDLVPSTT